jgi:hypothetical protein
MIGAKPPLLARHVWSIRTKLQMDKRTRDLAMFNLAIDSKLQGCDVVALRVEDVAPNGYALARATVRQRKTGRPVRFEWSTPAKPMMTTSRPLACSWATFCSQVGADPAGYAAHRPRKSGARLPGGPLTRPTEQQPAQAE